MCNVLASHSHVRYVCLSLLIHCCVSKCERLACTTASSYTTSFKDGDVRLFSFADVIMYCLHCCLVTEEVSERLLYLGNLPEEASDEDVTSLFPNARYVFVVRDTPSENGERKCKG